jgi:hypothetical protein
MVMEAKAPLLIIYTGILGKIKGLVGSIGSGSWKNTKIGLGDFLSLRGMGLMVVRFFLFVYNYKCQ